MCRIEVVAVCLQEDTRKVKSCFILQVKVVIKHYYTFDIGKQPYVADCQVRTPRRVIDTTIPICIDSNQPFPEGSQLGSPDKPGSMARRPIFLEEDSSKIVTRLKNGDCLVDDFTVKRMIDTKPTIIDIF